MCHMRTCVLENDAQGRIFHIIGRTNAEAESPELWPPDAKSQLIGKDTDERLRAGGEGGDRG